MNLPDQFRGKMQRLLGEEFEAFESGYDRPRRRGLRVNISKISPEEFERIAPFPLERIPWVDNGFFYPDEVRPARHPYYAAGLYYLQEPSAMAPAGRLPLKAGDRVLDLCAAPGGKATELASRLAVLDREKAGSGQLPGVSDSSDSDHGILIANDISQPRAKALLHNLEMTGTTNYCVLNETPERLAEAFPAYFDKILVDAPCSGEGMFRKEEEALRLWSPERVMDLAGQQKLILKAAYAMLRPGGMLLYSTCTFSPEENEQQIAAFLLQHPDMELQEIRPYEGFSPGRADWGPEGEASNALNISRCVRIWPHRMDGEGHFLALMRKDTVEQDNAEGQVFSERDGRDGTRKRSDRRKKKDVLRPDREQTGLLRSFLCDIAGNAAEAEKICRSVEIRQEKAFLPVTGEKLSGLHVMRGGIYLGDWKKKRFEPSQAWAMTQEKGKIRRTISFAADDPNLKRYLAGEAFAAEGMEDGWTLVLADIYPAGWTKIVRGTAKNHYPVSWRILENGAR